MSGSIVTCRILIYENGIAAEHTPNDDFCWWMRNQIHRDRWETQKNGNLICYGISQDEAKYIKSLVETRRRAGDGIILEIQKLEKPMPEEPSTFIPVNHEPPLTIRFDWNRPEEIEFSKSIGQLLPKGAIWYINVIAGKEINMALRPENLGKMMQLAAESGLNHLEIDGTVEEFMPVAPVNKPEISEEVAFPKELKTKCRIVYPGEALGKRFFVDFYPGDVYFSYWFDKLIPETKQKCIFTKPGSIWLRYEINDLQFAPAVECLGLHQNGPDFEILGTRPDFPSFAPAWPDNIFLFDPRRGEKAETKEPEPEPVKAAEPKKQFAMPQFNFDWTDETLGLFSDKELRLV